MSNYKFKTVARDDATYIFVTRARSKPISDEEVDEFFADTGMVTIQRPEVFEIPSTKVFAADLRAGINFCAKKYGVSTAAIERKAGEVFPHLNLNQLTG